MLVRRTRMDGCEACQEDKRQELRWKEHIDNSESLYRQSKRFRDQSGEHSFRRLMAPLAARISSRRSASDAPLNAYTSFPQFIQTLNVLVPRRSISRTHGLCG